MGRSSSLDAAASSVNYRAHVFLRYLDDAIFRNHNRVPGAEYPVCRALGYSDAYQTILSCPKPCDPHSLIFVMSNYCRFRISCDPIQGEDRGIDLVVVL